MTTTSNRKTSAASLLVCSVWTEYGMQCSAWQKSNTACQLKTPILVFNSGGEVMIWVWAPCCPHEWSCSQYQRILERKAKPSV